MTFRETLEGYLRAIRERDLPALAGMLPDGDLMSILPDGQLLRSVDGFVSLHEDWFASNSWSLVTRLEQLTECEAMGIAVIHLTYRDEPPDGDRIVTQGYLTLGFARQGDRWVMFHDQSTPIRPRSAR